MNKPKKYCEYMAFKFEDILKNSIFALVKGDNEGGYYLKDYDACSKIEQEEHLLTVEHFLEDLKSYLEGKSPINFIYEKNTIEIYQSFSRDILEKLIYDNPFMFPPIPVDNPTVDQLIRVASLFKDGCIRVDTIFDTIPRGTDSNGQDYEDFLLYLMTIPNKHLFENNQYIVNLISSEISTFTGYFYQETNLKVKNAFQIYLNNRKEFIEKINDPSLEERLFTRIKKSLASNYWSEVGIYFPNLVEQDRGLVRDNLIDDDNVQIYQLNLNKGAFYKICPSIINDHELESTFNLIFKAIAESKPEEISLMQDYRMDYDIKVIFSGKNIDDSYKAKVKKLFSLMLEEYNSENVNKYEAKEKRVDNLTYLKQAAKMHWLGVFLESSNTNNNKKIKI